MQKAFFIGGNQESQTAPSYNSLTCDASHAITQDGISYIINANGCAAGVAQTAGLASGSFFSVGTTTNTFQFSDGSSCSFNVTVVNTYQITTQPQNTSACQGSTATFTVAASGTNLIYKWYKDGQARSSKNSSTLTIDKVLSSDAGSYTVDVIGACGTVTSNVATLTVNTAPVIMVPTISTVLSNSDKCGATVFFAATATGNPAATISYTIGGTPITSPFFFPVGTTTVTASASNDCGTDTKSFNVSVKDITAPSFTAPAYQTLPLGANCSITIPDLITGLTGSDNCGTVTFTRSPVSGTLVSALHNQTTIVTITAQDGHGNTTFHYVVLTAKDTTAPIITAPAAITVSTDAGLCNASNVALGTPTYSDNCFGGATISNNAPTVFAKGTTTVTWTAKDAAGNTATATQKVTVQDNEKPVITSPNTSASFCNAVSGTYTIAPLTATDNCGIQSIAYAITGTTSRSGSGNDASGSFNTGASTITWRVTDLSGNTATYQTAVVISAPLSVSIPDVKVLSQGVNVNTVYTGYAPASSIILTAAVSGSGSYTYIWNTGATTASIKVSPTVTATYSVTVTNASGCAATASKVVKVVNAACGSKVHVCHGGNTLCINSKDVPDHLAIGDYLGACSSGNAITKTFEGKKAMNTEQEVLLSLKASPNPSAAYFKLTVISNDVKEKIIMSIVDEVGRTVETKTATAGQTLQIGDRYRAGVYFVQAIQGEKRVTLKLIKQAW